MKKSSTLALIVHEVSTRSGAPMGRSDIGTPPAPPTRIFDAAVPMRGAYDVGGAYWGLGPQLRVAYTKDLSYVEFYRLGDERRAHSN